MNKKEVQKEILENTLKQLYAKELEFTILETFYRRKTLLKDKTQQSEANLVDMTANLKDAKEQIGIVEKLIKEL